MRPKHILDNTPFGLFVGAVVASVVAIVLDAEIASEWKRWATYGATALVSLLSATLAVAGVLTNISKQDELAAASRKRKFLSAKAYLPLALSGACEIFRNGIRFSHQLASLIESKNSEEIRRESLDALELGDEEIKVFRELVEHSESDEFASYIATLLGEYQVALARWKGTLDSAENGVQFIDHGSEVRERTVFWAYLYAATAAVFHYARNDIDKFDPDVSEENIASALNMVTVAGLQSQDFSDEIGLYHRTFIRRFKNKEPDHEGPG